MESCVVFVCYSKWNHTNGQVLSLVSPSQAGPWLLWCDFEYNTGCHELSCHTYSTQINNGGIVLMFLSTNSFFLYFRSVQSIYISDVTSILTIGLLLMIGLLNRQYTLIVLPSVSHEANLFFLVKWGHEQWPTWPVTTDDHRSYSQFWLSKWSCCEKSSLW
jgi:hypothetical protein